jgi:hypothetical protein
MSRIVEPLPYGGFIQELVAGLKVQAQIGGDFPGSRPQPNKLQ